jgi:Zn-dependent M16 (insulinase) family peptidase
MVRIYLIVESVGHVLMGWRGYSFGDFLTKILVKVLKAYLTESTVSLLQVEFVQSIDPLCSGINML